MQGKNLAELAAQAAYDKRAVNIEIIDVSKLTVLTDNMVVCSGRSSTQVKAIADGIEEYIQQQTQRLPLRHEGYTQGRWVVIDYSDIIIHIFHEQEREYYNLERLWNDGFNTKKYSPEANAAAFNNKQAEI